MALWYETPDDQKDAYHWLQVALSLARRAGLDRNTDSINLPESERRTRKRLWWCLLIRDPLLALGLKRPISILPEHHDVPALNFHDLCYDMRQVGLSKLGLDRNPEKLRLLWSTCTTEAALHQCLSKIMSKQYTLRPMTRNVSTGDQTMTHRILLPDTSDDARATILDCENSLRQWRKTLPAELATTTLSPDLDDSTSDAFVVYRTVLHMLYYTCMITLYRPWIRALENPQNPSSPVAQDDLRMKAATTVRISAQSITKLAMDLHTGDLARHLPQTGLSALVAAIVSHISDLGSSDRAIRASGLGGFEQCSHALNELRENYYSADFSSDFVNLMMKARRLADAPLMTEPGAPSFDFNHQSSALGNFMSEKAPVLPRSLPEALFPQDPDLLGKLSPLGGNGSDLNNGINVKLLNTDRGTNLFDTAESREAYRNLREESARLLGDLFDEYQIDSFGMDPVTIE